MILTFIKRCPRFNCFRNGLGLLRRDYNKSAEYTAKLDQVQGLGRPIPIYRVMDENGILLEGKDEPDFKEEMAQKIIKDMITVSVMDQVLYEAQRQGRISFYMTSTGEEATHLGSAAALDPSDLVYAQYREVGVLIWRGFGINDVMNQCFGNRLDIGKGKQMPVHYGSPKHHFQTISSPLATQIPQAAGAAYLFKLKKSPNIVICYFGEGAASEGDFHAGLNIAATTDSPVIFFCRNNQYAISTCLHNQYRGDGIASRGPGYGIPTFRVDGNDVLAVYNVTKKARELIASRAGPVLIEAITYRIGHHSTSDDSLAYRSKEEIEGWSTKNDPIARFKNYLISKKWWSQTEDDGFRGHIKEVVLQELSRAEKEKKPPIEEMFNDVYDELPWNLKEQREELKRLLAKYPEDFPLDQFEESPSLKSDKK